MELADRISQLRKAKGNSITELAKVSGVSQPYLQQIEAGDRKNPSGKILQKLASALGTTVADLLGCPAGISQELLHQVPKSLRKMVKDKGKKLGLTPEDIEMLKAIHYRGKRPETPEDWELLFLFLRKLIG